MLDDRIGDRHGLDTVGRRVAQVENLALDKAEVQLVHRADRLISRPKSVTMIAPMTVVDDARS